MEEITPVTTAGASIAHLKLNSAATVQEAYKEILKPIKDMKGDNNWAEKTQ